MAHLLILCLATSCALWVLAAAQRLKATVHVKEDNLHDFLALSHGLIASRSQDPDRAAARLGRLLADRSWESTFVGLEPRIVMTASGPLLRLVKRPDGDDGATKGGPMDSRKMDSRKRDR